MHKQGLWMLLALSAALPAGVAQADEGGLGFWLPGQFGALAAVPTDPGWAFPLVYYHASAELSANEAIPRGGRGRLAVGVDAKADLLFGGPAYTFAESVLGGQAALAMLVAVGRSEVDVEATLTGPRGRTLATQVNDSLKGSSDL